MIRPPDHKVPLTDPTLARSEVTASLILDGQP